MSERREATGHCLCGAVSINAKAMAPEVGACHCGMCRRWTGGPLMAVDCGTEVTFDGEEYVSVYDSSPWAQRGFCSRCGSHLFYRIKANQQYIIPVGLFEERDDLVFSHQIFIDRKPSFYDFANATRNKTEAEVFAKCAPPESG
jgi:hypothetical protein